MPGNDQTAPYSRRDIRRAVNLSALLGWTVFTGFAIVSYGVGTDYWASTLSLVFWYGLFGIPTALLICWILVAPFLKIMMRNRVSFFRAARWGTGIGVFLVTLTIAIGRYRGWRQSLNPNFSSRIGGDGAIRSVDGILTPYGWWVLAQNSIFFIFLCILAALVIRMIIGSGSFAGSTEAQK
ncbi:hypothetical protein [Ruegeria meonggei]|uniref:hypothetical protein n=1 Tax=Ruegeria meonggei TaxID=1446476 RepID=UPI003670009D